MNYWENGHFNPEPEYVPHIIDFLGYDPFGLRPDGFSGQLKAARIAAGLTRRQLAARVGVHPGTVAEWERGEARPVARLRASLHDLLGVMEVQPQPFPLGTR